MEQPPRCVAQGEFGLVCRLRSSLYGLKQSPRAWFGRFSFVVDSDYNRSFSFLSSYKFRAVHLFDCLCDDIVITSNDQDGIQRLKQHLFSHFQTKDMGKLKYFMGIEIA